MMSCIQSNPIQSNEMMPCLGFLWVRRGYEVWEWIMGMMVWKEQSRLFELEYDPQMCIGDGFIFNQIWSVYPTLQYGVLLGMDEGGGFDEFSISSWTLVLGGLGQLAVGFPMLNIPEQASTPCIVDNFDELYKFIQFSR